MKQRIIALTLAAALSLSLLAVPAFAEGEGAADAETSAQAAQEDAADADTETAAGEEETTEDDPEGSGEEAAGEEGEEVAEEGSAADEVERAPDAVGTVSFANLPQRMRENNLSLLALEETIQSIEVLDYDEMADDLRKTLNNIAKGQHAMIFFGQGDSYTSSALQSTYDTLKESFDDLRDGEIQEDNEALVRQLKNAQDQTVMAGETLYIALVELELTDKGLARQEAALDRSVEEMELRYDLGQISALTLETVKAGRTSLVSGRETLEMNLKTNKMQLENLIGAEQTGGIKLQALPTVSAEELADMDLDADLAAAKEASYTLFAARRTLDDAKEDYEDEMDKYNGQTGKSGYQSAKHTWEAAQYTYNAAVQSFELSFNTLYLQVKDYQQILAAAQTSLAAEQSDYDSVKLKYDQGQVSENTLLTAQDSLDDAQQTVDSARIDLFSAYNNYCWARDYGILN